MCVYLLLFFNYRTWQKRDVFKKYIRRNKALSVQRKCFQMSLMKLKKIHKREMLSMKTSINTLEDMLKEVSMAKGTI